MNPNLARPHQEVLYEHRAQDYLTRLPVEHFMEAISQARQRMITLASLALLKALRPEVQFFNELLVQYPRPRKRKLGQVVPDNMLVLTTEPIHASTSYNVPLEPVSPFLMFEFISKSNMRKNLVANLHKYERELKVPYCVICYLEAQELAMYQHDQKQYVTVTPNEHGRYPIPELDLELSILDEWMRFWYQGELLPLPAELQSELEKARRHADEEKRRADEAQRRVEELVRRLEASERENVELRACRGKT